MKRKYNQYKDIVEVFNDGMTGIFMLFVTLIFFSILFLTL
jgi:hypothetical protein